MNKKPYKEILEATVKASNNFRCPVCQVLCLGGTKIKNCGHFVCTNCPNDKHCTKCKAKYSRDDIIYDDLSKRLIKYFMDIEIMCNATIYKTNINKRNTKGETALHLACKRKNFEQVKSLLNSGTNPNVKDYAGWTPLHEAVLSKDLRVVKALVEAGAIVDVLGDSYVTPLQKAVIEDNVEIVKYLIENGADAQLRNYNGLTALDLASESLRDVILSTEPSLKKKDTYENSVLERYVVYILNNDKFNDIKKAIDRIDELEIVKKMSSEVTHIIVDDPIVDISDITIIRAIVNQLNIVTYNWLEECAKNVSLIDYRPYFIRGTEIFQNNVMESVQEYRNKMWPKLFDGLKFYISGFNHKFKLILNNRTITQTDIIDIIKSGGGNILKREPHIRNIETKCYPWHAPRNSTIEECCHYIVYTGDPELKYNMKELKHVPAIWIIECVWKNKLIPLDEIEL